MKYGDGENKGGRKRNLDSGRSQEPRGEKGRKRNLNPGGSPESREGSIMPSLNKRRSRELREGESITQQKRSRKPREGSITQSLDQRGSRKPGGIVERSGQTLLNEKRYGEALEFYDRRLLVKPRNADLHVGKGEALLGLGRSKEALAVYEEAIRLAPEFSEAYRGRGKVYEQLAQQVYEDLTQQAQECYEKAKQLGVG